MTLLHRARSAVRRLGLDVARYPDECPDHQVARLLDHHRVDVVLDVGAHTGHYASQLRVCGYRGRITSFEPVGELHRQLLRRAAGDPRWHTVRGALGDRPGTAVINVAGNAGASSSLLPMLDLHTEASPGSAYVRTEEVRVERLDALWPGLVAEGERAFLKLDVQGFERQVLDGAGERVADCAGLQLEMSLVPLYDGGMLHREALDWAQERGFTLMHLLPGFTDGRTGRMYQCDAVLFRE
ncbi:FkbM family methyltransferase [Kitasatospora sp. NPDC093679]|uniref:FkbM family methyltransferase n=1 Tax=Kitasatospora sp. NPDC093679 TaxID=3154983 RepID=UPI003445A261